MTKTELLAKVKDAGYFVLKDTPMPKNNEPPYSRHQLSYAREVGTLLEKKKFDYLVKDDGGVFFLSGDPFSEKAVVVKSTFEAKLAEYMSTLNMPRKVKSDEASAVVSHYIVDGVSLKETTSYCELDDKDDIAAKDITIATDSV